MNRLLNAADFNEDISITEGTKDEIVVFENSNDRLSFLELLKLNSQSNDRNLLTLNSAVNAKKFLNRYQNFEGKIFLCLTGDRTGNAATRKILAEFKNKNIKDIRSLYQISETENRNLSDYLQNKLNLQSKNINLIEPNNSQNGNTIPRSERISNPQQVESGAPEQNSGKLSPNIQSEQNGDHSSGQRMGSDDAGNGLADTIWEHLVGYGKRGRSNDGAQPQNDEKNERGKHSLGGILSGRTVSDRGEDRGAGGRQVSDVENLLEQYKGQKVTNEQVAEVVSATCFVSGDFKVNLKEDLKITDDLKEICSQFKSGGTAKEGRGILDEYYTDSKIVNAVRNLIKDQFKNKPELSVLEPSVGMGNFLYATQNLGIKTAITAFEINNTTAKIAKILHPEANINLRSFETEFIDEKGNKKESEDFSEKYDLVIGNPPYGEHRGLYKGLGEEPQLSKYEDYFVKRSLDSLKPNGVLAMVLPSGWLNRQKKLQNARILEGLGCQLVLSQEHKSEQTLSF